MADIDASRGPVAPGDRKLLPLPPGARVILGDPSQVLGRSWGQALAWLVLLAAAGVDIATFYQVLILVMNAPDEVVWGAVVGFTAVALTLAHHTGTQYRDATSPGGDSGSRISAWACFGIWLILGATAFSVRWFVEPADSSGGAGGSSFVVDGQSTPVDLSGQTTSQHLSALLFLVLYLATGTVSALTGYGRPNPAARRWVRAQRKRSKATRRFARIQSELTNAMQLKDAIERERERRIHEFAGAEKRCFDTATRLQQEARLALRGLRRPMPQSVRDPRSNDDDAEGES